MEPSQEIYFAEIHVLRYVPLMGSLLYFFLPINYRSRNRFRRVRRRELREIGFNPHSPENSEHYRPAGGIA